MFPQSRVCNIFLEFVDVAILYSFAKNTHSRPDDALKSERPLHHSGIGRRDVLVVGVRSRILKSGVGMVLFPGGGKLRESCLRWPNWDIRD
jgi:hypothetical protein